MCKAMEEMRNEAVDRDRVHIALKMLADGLAIDKVAQYTQLTVERIKELAKMQPARP